MKNFIRDENSGAVLNTNRADYVKAKKKLQEEKEKEDRISRLEEKQDEISYALQRLETLLLGITNGKS